MHRRSKRSTLVSLALGITLTAGALPATAALASEPRIVVSSASPIPSHDTVVRHSITASFDIVLAQPHRAGLASFISSLSNTASANYHHYLTPKEFGQRFGASAADVATVRTYLTRYGLGSGSLSSGRIILHASGLTSNITRAFGAPVATVRLASGQFAAQFTAPATLPASIAHDVINVAGLSTVVPPVASASLTRSTTHATTAGSCPAASNIGASGYTLQQQAQLYGFTGAWNRGDTGATQTIGVYELGAYDASDVATYFACYHLSPSITNVNVDGGATGGADAEATLDVEEAGGLAPGAAIAVYTGPNNSSGPIDVYQRMADQNTATIITTSWGGCEASPGGNPSSEQPIFEQMAAQGQTVVAAAGDSGSSDCAGTSGVTNPNALAVDDPASQPFVTGVGGLSVTNISPLGETVWNDANGAGGGGASLIWSRPSWQKTVGPDVSFASHPMRMVPDVSVMADPNYGFIEYFTGSSGAGCQTNCTSGWSAVGGTSIGSPLVSALFAVAAQSCNMPRLGFINPTLYAMPSSNFNDVTTGNNILYGPAGSNYQATTGYDMASGLGSPNANSFIAGLCPAQVSLTNSKYTQTVTTTAKPATVTATLRNSRNLPVANAAVQVVATASSGTIMIDGVGTSSGGGGNASEQLMTNAAGSLIINVTTMTAGPVTVTLNYMGASIHRTVLNFAKAPTIKNQRPARPTILKLTSLVGGFRLTVKAPSRTGGSPITLYQYSRDDGASWKSFARRSRSITVTKLAKKHRYEIIVRVRNSSRASVASKRTSVITLA